MKYQPEQPHGVLYDANGNLAICFGNFSTDEKHEVPDYVEGERTPDYVPGPDDHSAHGLDLEVSPDRDDLPDPARPPKNKNLAPEFEH